MNGAVPHSSRDALDHSTDTNRACSVRLAAAINADQRSSEMSTCITTPETDAFCQDDYTVSPASAFHNRKQVRDRADRLMLKNLTFEELEAWCISEGALTLPFVPIQETKRRQ